uniref:Uncharacterized protein n=1 Tax=Vitis vinifera TaxID=29760 RepID=F6HBI9_VITVI
MEYCIHPDYEALATKKRHNFAHALGMNGPEGLVFNRGALRYTHQPVHGTTKT